MGLDIILDHVIGTLSMDAHIKELCTSVSMFHLRKIRKCLAVSVAEQRIHLFVSSKDKCSSRFYGPPSTTLP